jgi:hypothetical protein
MSWIVLGEENGRDEGGPDGGDVLCFLPTYGNHHCPSFLNKYIKLCQHIDMELLTMSLILLV